MVLTLRAAQIAATDRDAAAADKLLKAFIDEVSESVKSLTAADAAILIQDAQALMR
jgi:hypothetical protein